MGGVGSLLHSEHKAWENNRQVDMFCCYHQPSLTKAPLATSVRARANLGGNGWSLGREGVREGGVGKALRWLRVRLRGGGGKYGGGMGVILQIIKQSNKITGE